LIKIGECSPKRVQFDPKDIRYRRADGKYNDPFNVDAGSAGTCFGRNVPPADQKDKVLKNLKVALGQYVIYVYIISYQI
jgi:hypothetical protein